MSMANREKSEPAQQQHETFPGPGPSRNPQNAGGMPPVEQMVDAAIDRLAREYAAGGHDLTPALERVPKGSGLAPDDSRLLTDGRSSSGKRSGKLRWKGLDVSDEFRQYAERVARGEDLPPYEGKILAEPDPAFPWEPAARRSASRRARTLHGVLWGSAVVVAGLACWMISIQVSARGGLRSGAVAAENAEQAILSSRAFPSEVDSAQTTTRPAAEESQVVPGLGAAGKTENSKAGWNGEEDNTELAKDKGELAARVEASPAGSASSPSEAPSPASAASRAATRDLPATPQRADSGRVAAASTAAPAPAGPNGPGAAAAPRPNSTGSFGVAAQPGAASPVNVAVNTPTADASRGNSATPAGTVAGVKPARKEPAPAPSGMGSLLVETPSF